MYVIVPSPQTVLDQLPADPTPHQVDFLAEAIYYASQDYTEPTFPQTYYQLFDPQRYRRAAVYLLQRRQRPEARPPQPEQRRARALDWLREQVVNYPSLLTDQAGQLTIAGVQAFLQRHYAGEPGNVLAGWAQLWLDNPPPGWADWYWWKKA